MNLFLVTSPFQYICALEAKNEYKCQFNILLLVEQDYESGIRQQDKLIDNRDWDNIIRIPRTNRSKHIPNAIKRVQKIIKGNKINCFFHAEYNAWRTKLILRNFIIEKEIYFDDGTLTINEYETKIRTKKAYYRPRLIQDLMILLRGIKPIGKLPQSKQLEIFTIFDIPDPIHTLRKNNLSLLKEKYKVTSLYSSTAPIGFIGEGAIGHKRKKTKEQYIEEIKAFINNSNKPVIYFPHRTESEEVKSALLEIPNLTYHNSELPLEIELIEKRIQLSCLVGLLSTVQYTALLLYPGMPIYTFRASQLSTDPDYLIREKRLRDIFEAKGIVDYQ